MSNNWRKSSFMVEDICGRIVPHTTESMKTSGVKYVPRGNPYGAVTDTGNEVPEKPY
jgi:hypothetical protein